MIGRLRGVFGGLRRGGALNVAKGSVTGAKFHRRKDEFQGKTIIILRLGAAGSIASGIIQLAGFQLDLKG